MYSAADVPPGFRRFFFVNQGGPRRSVLSRDVVEKKWQLATLECGHRVLVPKYVKAARMRCGTCGGLRPLGSDD